MPTYDYYCEANGRTIEAIHKMSETVGNWGELCEKAGIETGDTPKDAPVFRTLTSAAYIGTGSSTGTAAREIPTGGGCASGACGCPF